MMSNASALENSISFLPGVGPKRAELLTKELGIVTWADLLFHLPFRYVDRTKFTPIGTLRPDSGEVLIKGIVRSVDLTGAARKKRLVVKLRDNSGVIELVWFQGATWIADKLTIGKAFVAFGRINAFGRKLTIPHPELEEADVANQEANLTLSPVYSSTDQLTKKGLDAKGLRKLQKALWEKLETKDIAETLPGYLLDKYRLQKRFLALQQIHFPKGEEELLRARKRLKFEELFYMQLRLLQIKMGRKNSIRGYAFEQVGALFNQFYSDVLPFDLTNAQKRVIREIRADVRTNAHMNRLLQGDVGSGKTVVALLVMLLAIDNDFQACMMAPTEILAQQHYQSLQSYTEPLGITVQFLSGNITGKARAAILEELAAGNIHILVGTHAVLEPPVVFKNLGIAVIDEQHRFGVKQRSRLWKKGITCPPHMLVMSATPIPRTLAMTRYGDLEVSIIDELPPGRKPITTLHKTERHRPEVITFMRNEIQQGRQVYVVFPMIDENENIDLKNLQSGYDQLLIWFPLPDFQISVVHGKMKAADKEKEMQRFVEGHAQIMVATTVIEVGVNVPNASVMIIENTERFGLSQLHQLRGRVGRGADKAYCILMTGNQVSKVGRKRIETMVRTQNGFEIAEVDLQLRGPGDIEGTQQSGVVNLLFADLAQDGPILQAARDTATQILKEDPLLEHPANLGLRNRLARIIKQKKGWSRIS